MPLNFRELMQPVKTYSVLKEETHCVWGGTMTRHTDGRFYVLYARWPKSSGHQGWVICSEIGWAVSDSPLGPWEIGGVALAGSGGNNWDADCVHNPTMISHENRYYLYYMANRGNGEYWNHRNNQRIGVAFADHPAGPWTRSEAPVIDVSPGSHDHLMTSNPTVSVRPDGGIIMVYKAVGAGKLPKGGPVVCGVAFAAHPLGPFKKESLPIMVNPEDDWSVADPYIWYGDDRYYALVKDFQSYFSRGGHHSVALFESTEGINWQPAEISLAFEREILWEEEGLKPVHRLERPQILLDESGKPEVLLCAATDDEEGLDTYNVQIPLRR